MRAAEATLLLLLSLGFFFQASAERECALIAASAHAHFFFPQLCEEKNTKHVLSLVPCVRGITGWPTLKRINSPRFVQMIQSIKFTSLFWHSQEWPGSEDDRETKTDPPTPPPVGASSKKSPQNIKTKPGPLEAQWLLSLCRSPSS